MNKTELQALITEKKAELRLLQAEVNKLLQEEWWLENPTLVSFDNGWDYTSDDEGSVVKCWYLRNLVWTDGLKEDEYQDRRDMIRDEGEYPGFEDIEEGTVIINPNL